jgi:7-cyano-7-deazaguanine reductase
MMDKQPGLELFENPCPKRDYLIRIDCPEFTSLCPKTGQPDFGRIAIEYCPDRSCIELKSLKFYIQSYRNEGVFYEDLANRILDDLVKACKPRWMEVCGDFAPRGGITTRVTARHGARPSHEHKLKTTGK